MGNHNHIRYERPLPQRAFLLALALEPLPVDIGAQVRSLQANVVPYIDSVERGLTVALEALRKFKTGLPCLVGQVNPAAAAISLQELLDGAFDAASDAIGTLDGASAAAWKFLGAIPEELVRRDVDQFQRAFSRVMSLEQELGQINYRLSTVEVPELRARKAEIENELPAARAALAAIEARLAA